MDSFPSQPILLLLLLFLLIFAVVARPSLSTPTTDDPPPTNPVDFIRSSCNTTLYPDICYTSLSRYANAVGLDPAQMARISIGVTLVKAHHTATFFNNLTKQSDYYTPNPRATSALHDCSATFRDAVDQIRGSLKQMTQLVSATGSSTPESIRFQVSNVQTWMSAALTNEDTCTDGFQDVADCPIKNMVGDKVVTVKQLNSNALALVNSYADSVNYR
ncbi:21 kDa protein-like [Amaranthus tricolor]|uniref:21 kDa protein-like n=1 Tax=Amaranthus tricolor TaxID=29722 RepID=UPI00258ED9BC|nr:21 kDa protein-like [Amaranthus tricolor]